MALFVTILEPRGHTRNRGRQKTRWRDDLDKFKKHWHREARLDRQRCRQMERTMSNNGSLTAEEEDFWIERLRSCVNRLSPVSY